MKRKILLLGLLFVFACFIVFESKANGAGHTHKHIYVTDVSYYVDVYTDMLHQYEFKYYRIEEVGHWEDGCYWSNTFLNTYDDYPHTTNEFYLYTEEITAYEFYLWHEEH